MNEYQRHPPRSPRSGSVVSYSHAVGSLARPQRSGCLRTWSQGLRTGASAQALRGMPEARPGREAHEIGDDMVARGRLVAMAACSSWVLGRCTEFGMPFGAFTKTSHGQGNMRRTARKETELVGDFT